MRDSSAVFSADHYVQRLDLGADPFEKGYRSDYFFGGGQRSQVLDQVLHFSRYGEQTVLLLGSTGSGTSTVLHQVLDRISPIMEFCTVDGESVGSPGQLLASLARQLQLGDVAGIIEFVTALGQREQAESGSEPLLVAVDQAHFLSIECLDLLRQLKLQSGSDLHLLLAGEYQVEQLIKLAGFEASQLKSLELEPLNVSETGDYLLGVLQSVGYAGEQPLTVDQLAVLHEQSGGNITEINLLTPTLLGARRKNGNLAMSMSIPVPHMAAIAVLVLAIGISLWFQGEGDSEEAAPTPSTEVATDSVAPTAREQVPLSLDLADEAAPEEEGTDTAEAENETADAPAVSPDPMQSQLAGAEMQPQSPMTGTIERQPTASPQAPGKPAASKVESSAPDTRKVESAVAAIPAPRPQAPKAPPVSVSPPAKPVAVHTNQTSPGDSPTSAPKVTKSVSAPAVESPVAHAVAPREQHLLEMNADQFLLQLMGASEEARARGLVKSYVGQLPITYFEARRQGKPWYVVVTGPYASKQEARDGVDELPGKLRAQQPWVRSVAGVQQEIRALHQ